MSKFYALSLALLFLSSLTFGQQKIDSTLAYQTDPLKGFSVYLPSTYDPTGSNPLMLAFHPFNTSTWDASIWRDSLLTFAETNGLVLLCPDGGPDGKVDDPIDTSFTTFLLDRMPEWYHTDPQRTYVMGFSWGGRSVYTYGLANSHRFAGFMPIAAAVEGGNQISGQSARAFNKLFYLIHGTSDSPGIRFYPSRDSLEAARACVQTHLLAGVGHTFDFPNRNALMTEAFTWLTEASCNNAPVGITPTLTSHGDLQLFPNPVLAGSSIHWKANEGSAAIERIMLYDISGKVAIEAIDPVDQVQVPENLLPGIYLLIVETNGQLMTHKIFIK